MDDSLAVSKGETLCSLGGNSLVHGLVPADHLRLQQVLLHPHLLMSGCTMKG